MYWSHSMFVCGKDHLGVVTHQLNSGLEEACQGYEIISSLHDLVWKSDKVEYGSR
jgi:hypothetical protein